MSTHVKKPSCGANPWLDPDNRNLFKDEFALVKDLKIDPWLEQAGCQFEPIEVYRWIEHHQGESLFFKALARLAPMFPVYAYHGHVASWISPPPSGWGNAIYIVAGHDAGGSLRLVGGNYFTAITRRCGNSGLTISSSAFFASYDAAKPTEQKRLICDVVSESVSRQDEPLIRNVIRECEHFHTMPIFLTALTNSGSLFHMAKAVIEGVRPADFSFEFLGEIK